MSEETTDLLVVGGGPAGASAAIAAATHGISSVLIEEGDIPGGQIYRARRSPDAPEPDPEGERIRRDLVANRNRIDVRTNTSVWGVFDRKRVCVIGGDACTLLTAKQIILAPGAQEYVPPFRGWTLPGVMTAGGAQALLKMTGVAPGRRIVLAGSGPLLLAVAAQMTKLGHQVVSVFQAASRGSWMTLPLRAWQVPQKAFEGIKYFGTLKRAGVRMHYGRMVVSAHGDQRLTGIDHAPVDASWRPDLSRIETIDADSLCISYGLMPRTDLFQIFGCKMRFCEMRGGWHPERDNQFRTSQRDVFAVGDGAGISGSSAAILEGQLAGNAVAHALGACSDASFRGATHRLGRALRTVHTFGAAINQICYPRVGLLDLVTDDTIVCRCEELTWKEVRTGIEHGGTDFRTLKSATRLGMGPCQAKFCWPSASRQVARLTERAMEDIGPISVRNPIRPISLGALAKKGAVSA